MTAETTRDIPVLRDLGGGLILRRSTPADTEALATFNAEIHRDDDSEEDRIAIWTRDLMSGEHPTFGVGDFTIVEDTDIGAIVSVSNLISQTWTYDGIEVGVGRPELVGTHADYRRRGLVRVQFDVLHAWSAERGERMQAITGIPWFYRQFGYEMGLSLGGGRIGYEPHVPELEDDEEELYHARPAELSDVGFMAEVYADAARRYRMACVRDEALWRYEVTGKRERNANRSEFRVIETPDGEPVGFLVHQPWLWGPTIGATVYELKAGVSWVAVTPSVVRYLWETGQTYVERDESEEGLGAFAFWLGAHHPAYDAISDKLPRQRDPYAWYVRVPDVPDFLRHVAPALERRLDDSVGAGHTGELKVNLYRGGLRLVLEDGQLAGVEPWMAPRITAGDAAFPDRTFLQLLFGYRSLEELEHAFADCWVDTDQARALLDALFPKQPSDVWPVA